MGIGEIWVCARDGEAGRHIKKVFDEANLFNPLRIIDGAFDFDAHFKCDGENPALLLLDLDLPGQRVWQIISAIRGTGFEPRLSIVALVDDSTEQLLDQAYDAGVKTYLRKPLAFGEFVACTRLLNMQLMIDHPDGSSR